MALKQFLFMFHTETVASETLNERTFCEKIGKGEEN